MGTKDDIQQRINDRLTINANKLEGGFSQDIIGSVSYELANIKETEIDTMADRCFVSTAKGEDLDKVGADYGIPRRKDKAANVYITITGEQYSIVNQNVKLVYENLIYTVQEYAKIGESGQVTVKAQCDTLGTIGNIPANTITQFLTEYTGLKTATNSKPAYDGFDEEDDEIYRQRILDYLAEDATNANEAQYRKWAQEVTGVQKAIIKSAEIMGAGNVGVYISAIDSMVSEDLKTTVKEHIESVQPINATVIVNSLDYKKMSVSAQIVPKNGYELADIKEEFVAKFKEYLITVNRVVSYFKVSELLFDCSGIDDVIEYTLNGGNVSVNLEDIDYPIVGEVEVVAG